MHDRQDDKFIRINAVEERIRKSSDQTPPDTIVDNRPLLWCTDKISQRQLNLSEKILAQPRGLHFIITSGIE